MVAEPLPGFFPLVFAKKTHFAGNERRDNPCHDEFEGIVFADDGNPSEFVIVVGDEIRLRRCASRFCKMGNSGNSASSPP